MADARAKAGAIEVRPADPAADRVALERLGLWAMRYAPFVAPFDEAGGADGLFLDVTGATHLWGGERGLLADLGRRLQEFGLATRLALAGTPGAAWALARFGENGTILPSGDEARSLRALPVAALRLPPDTSAGLRRLGLKRVGDLLGQPRAPLVSRFGQDLVRRLDWALGRVPEPLVPLVPPAVYGAVRAFLDPVRHQDAIVAAAGRLMTEIVPALVRDGVGARALRLTLFRVDGEAARVDLGLAAPSRDARHVERLTRLKLDRLGEAIDAGFGFEAVRLDVVTAEPLRELTGALLAARAEPDGRIEELFDALIQRLGPESVRRLAPVASFWPERASASRPVEDAALPWPEVDGLRPLLLFSPAEPAEVMALVPEGPPRRFRWRGTDHRVAHAQGPERIAPEWWRDDRHRTRDYYVVESERGHRFWLFREGLYGRETSDPRWFVHGLFP